MRHGCCSGAPESTLVGWYLIHWWLVTTGGLLLNWKENMGKAFFSSLALLASYSVVCVAANHGIGPVGLIMVTGREGLWLLGMALGWLGWVAIFGSFVFPKGKILWSCQVTGLAFVFMSWCVFISQTIDFSFTLITSVPFLIVVVVRVIQLGKTFIELSEP